MKKYFTHENFERFLKESADDLQLRPAEDVWRRIEGRLSRRRRWVLFTSAFFLITASLFGYIIVDQSKAPSDPFIAIHPIQKDADAPLDTKTGSVVTLNAPSNRLSPTAINSTVASISRNAVNSTRSLSSSQLFQNPIPGQNATAAGPEAAATPFTLTLVDEQEPFNTAAPATSLLKQNSTSDILSIESVINLYQPKFRKHKSEFQLFFTPTVSYRRLTENKSYLRAVPLNLASYNLAALYDVNSMVTHKPDLGLELGFAFKFPISGRIKLRTGMQFNINRYDIKAFTYVPERTTIALNTRRARGIDSVNTISSYRNFNGGREDWLQNFYFQVSTPIGVEVALSNAKKTRFGIAGTIQPTYVLGDRAYLISTDYNNYSQVPWLIRRWNVNTSLETFVSYSTGKLRWQVGPQVRYQLLSSFVEKYPVKENLFDFGVKIGVSLNNK